MSKDLMLNMQQFKSEILEKDFNGNQAQCAKALGISASYLCNVLKNPAKKPGTALFSGIVIYCDKTKREAMNFMKVPREKRSAKGNKAIIPK